MTPTSILHSFRTLPTMATYKLVSKAAESSIYSADHIRHLLTTGLIKGKKQGRFWLVDMEDLKRYEEEIQAQGSKKYDPTKNVKLD